MNRPFANKKTKMECHFKQLGKMPLENSKSSKNILLKWIYFPYKGWKSYQQYTQTRNTTVMENDTWWKHKASGSNK